MTGDPDDLHGMGRRGFLRRLFAGALIASLTAFPEKTEAVTILNIASPKRRIRPGRKSTRFIILHTTEAEGPGTLECITRGGTANYVVDPAGRIYRIMGSTQISVGCGRSMWNGLVNLDRHAINIEVVGYHDRPPSGRQVGSLGYLLSALMKSYGLRARDVMPHSQVAYGRPNRWYRRSHRGRKRCGMIFAAYPLRRRLGLLEKPGHDPDVRAKRLVVGDEFLWEVLYSKRAPAFIAANAGAAMEDPEDSGPAVRILLKGQTVWEHAGDEYASSTTIYLLPDGRIRRGDHLLKERFDFHNTQYGTRIAVGYVYGGCVTEKRTPYGIAGDNWNDPDTLYITDGKILTGDEISDERIPAGTLLLFRR